MKRNFDQFTNIQGAVRRTGSYYRIECNYGSKYFVRKVEAVAYFDYYKSRVLETELWHVRIIKGYDGFLTATQVMISAYSPKYP